MRVKSVAVKGLFGVFDHEIPLRSAERVTIIHGPNGFGKTVILKMISGLIEGKTEIFEHTPFREFILTLDDDSSRIIRRLQQEDPNIKAPKILLEFVHRDAHGNETSVKPSRTPEVPRSVLTMVDRKVPHPYRLTGSSWMDSVNQLY